MVPQKMERLLRLGRFALRSMVVYLFFAMSSVSSWLIADHNNYNARGQFTYLPISALCAACLTLSLLFYYSLVRAESVHNDGLRDRFLAVWDRNDPPRFGKRLKTVLGSPELHSDWIVHSFLLLVFPSAFGHRPLLLLLGDYAGKGAVLLIMIPALALLCFAAKLSACSAWSVEWSRKANKPRPQKTPLRRPLLRAILLWGIFLLTAALSPLGLRSVYSLYQILRLANPWILIPVIVGGLFFCYLIRLFIAVGKRLRLLRRLRAFCKKNGYELLNVKNSIRTLVFPHGGANFALQKEDVRYDCRLISSLRRHSPLLFREEGTVTCTHVFRFFTLNLFHYDVTYDFQFESDGKKILVLLPAPIEVFVSGFGVTQLAESGSRIADCTLYGAADFLHALERNVVGR